MIAGLTAAIGGQLLIYEHYVLAESVFVLLIGLAMLALMAAVSRGHLMAMLGGLALGVASLFRPVAEVMLPIVPAFFLVTIGPRRRLATLSAAMAGRVPARHGTGDVGRRRAARWSGGRRFRGAPHLAPHPRRERLRRATMPLARRTMPRWTRLAASSSAARRTVCCRRRSTMASASSSA